MSKNRKPTQAEVLRLGPEIAAVKASMPRKRWRRFVKDAHRKGFTVAGQLSGAPGPLKERTGASLRKQATRATAAAYKPVMTELNRREKAAGFLESKRAADDAAYRMWMMGEVDKLGAQAAAADTALQTQQAQIASELKTAQQAGKADSLARVQQVAGGVSDPSQSAALDTSAADTRSREKVAQGREHTAALQKIGDDAATMSRAALVATAAVREATRTAENWKTVADISADRSEALSQRAADTKGMIQDLRAGEVSKAQTLEELLLAGAELGVKKASIAAEAKEAARKYGLDKKKFNLDRWKARNADAVARAKVQLGYDQIVEREGKAAADRALKRWATKYQEKQRNARDANDGGGGKDDITQDERDVYKTVDTVRTLLVRKLRNGKDERTARRELVDAGFDNITIDVANDLRRNNGMLSSAGVQKAKRLGVTHVGYFWDKQRPTTRPHDSQQP